MSHSPSSPFSSVFLLAFPCPCGSLGLPHSTDLQSASALALPQHEVPTSICRQVLSSDKKQISENYHPKLVPVAWQLLSPTSPISHSHTNQIRKQLQLAPPSALTSTCHCLQLMDHLAASSFASVSFYSPLSPSTSVLPFIPP